MPSLIGLATLGGVVVNNAILLIEFMVERIGAGESAVEAAGGAARDRLRAILLTSITTIAGLTPMLLETSTQAQLLIPLVASLAFGLSSATLLALFVVPAAAVMLTDLGHALAPRATAQAGREAA
jgi:multidrug efflux pump subunit AcrB